MITISEEFKLEVTQRAMEKGMGVAVIRLLYITNDDLHVRSSYDIGS